MNTFICLKCSEYYKSLKEKVKCPKCKKYLKRIGRLSNVGFTGTQEKGSSNQFKLIE